MDEKVNQAEETHVPAADQAPSEASAETPTVSAEQGVGDMAAAQTPPDAPEEATAHLTQGDHAASLEASAEAQTVQHSDAQHPDEEARESSRPGLGVAAAVGAALGAVALGAAAFNRARQDAPEGETVRETLEHMRDDAGSALSDAAERVSDTVSDTAARAAELAADATDKARHAADDALETLGEVREQAGEALGAAAETVRERVSDAAETVRDVAVDTAETVRETASDAAGRAAELAADTTERVRDTAGRLAEDARLGERVSDAAETVRDTAAQMMEQTADKAREVAEHARLGERAETAVQAVQDTAASAVERVQDIAGQVHVGESAEDVTARLSEVVAGAVGAAEQAVRPPEPQSRFTNDMSMEEVMTMEDVLAASDEQLARPPIHRGMIATGSIIMLAQDGIVVDVGAKIEGLLPYNQLFEFDANAEEAAKYFKAGDEIQVYVVRADIPNNTIILSKKRADQERAWNLLQDIHDRNLPVEVEIVEKVRGGLVANLGVRAFLPASQVDIRRVNDLGPFVGRRVKVKIIELNRKRNRVIVSRRSIMEEEVEGLKAETLRRLEPGLQLEGEVVEITDFGAFVNLGGVDGLVHRSELSHGRFNHPREAVELGQKVRVEVLDMDLERERINLSMKKLIANPWQDVLVNYSIGQRVAGKVTNLTPFGAFVEIEPGLEGLIHVSEMSWTKRIRHPKEIVTEGESVEAMILKIDSEQERISLGLRQTQPDPWSSLPDRYPPGTEVTGPITGITEFGVFMEIEEGIEGLVHISELAHEHIEQIEDHFQKGEEVTAVILNIDPIEQRASLSRKRLMPFTAAAGSDMPLGAPASRGGAARKGRRGGRRSAGIDYDYSYAQADPASKATTKLGDVYADLFAQFGLTDKKDDAKASEPQAEADRADSAQPEAARTEPAQAEAPRGDSTRSDTERSHEAEPVRERAPEAQAEADEVDPENAIDAAEAAALLTAAFREGKRPMRQDSAPTQEPSSQNAETEAEASEAEYSQGDDAEDSMAQAFEDQDEALEDFRDSQEKTEV